MKGRGGGGHQTSVLVIYYPYTYSYVYKNERVHMQHPFPSNSEALANVTPTGWYKTECFRQASNKKNPCALRY